MGQVRRGGTPLAWVPLPPVRLYVRARRCTRRADTTRRRLSAGACRSRAARAAAPSELFEQAGLRVARLEQHGAAENPFWGILFLPRLTKFPRD